MGHKAHARMFGIGVAGDVRPVELITYLASYTVQTGVPRESIEAMVARVTATVRAEVR